MKSPTKSRRWFGLVIALSVSLAIIILISVFKGLKSPPDNIYQCLNKRDGSNYEHYMVAATLLQNQRKYVREWIEFHKLMGFTHFILYDNNSEDEIKELLKPYIEDGTVTHIVWPPKKEVNQVWNDVNLENHYKSNLEECLNNNRIKHRQYNCQVSSFDDAVRRTRGKARWLAIIDVDEYYYLPSNSTLSNSNKPLAEVFRTLESHDLVTVWGQHFGTNGWVSSPRRDDDKSYSQLVTKTHTRHMEYHGIELIPILEHRKTFTDPYCVFGSEVHTYLYDRAWISSLKERHIFHDEHFIYLNHYNWLSEVETKSKAIANLNPMTGYGMEYDLLLNKQQGLTINYLLEKLEKQIENSIKSHKPADGHADDWDPSLFRKKQHIFKPEAKQDLCVLISSPTHIGLLRQSLTSIINYLYLVEPDLNYMLIVQDSTQNLLTEIKNDFPIDLFLNKESSPLNKFCSGEVVIHLKEDSFARWEAWPQNVKVLRTATNLLKKESSVEAIYLGDSSNLMSEWQTDNEDQIIFRVNPGLTKQLHEIYLQKKPKTFYGNEIKGLFAQYYQDRNYGYEPGSL
jgi:hypothetical protein